MKSPDFGLKSESSLFSQTQNMNTGPPLFSNIDGMNYTVSIKTYYSIKISSYFLILDGKRRKNNIRSGNRTTGYKALFLGNRVSQRGCGCRPSHCISTGARTVSHVQVDIVNPEQI